MPETSQNTHYEQVSNILNTAKDSIFEPCKIVDFDTKRLMAKVTTVNSKQTRDDVPVLFPSLFMNTGIITFPVKDSNGLLLWGADKEPYVLPAQFLIPTKNTENGVVKPNASPGQYEKILTLENMEPGEVLVRALGGCQLVIRNLGEIELATPKMHRLSLFEIDGSLEQIVERTRSRVSGFSSYNGPYESITQPLTTSEDHHMNMEIRDLVPHWNEESIISKDLLNTLMNCDGNFQDYLEQLDRTVIAEGQFVNVYAAGTDQKIRSEYDGKELLGQLKLYERYAGNSRKLRTEMEMSKGGTVKIKTSFDNSGIEIYVTEDEYKIKTRNANAVLETDRSAVRVLKDGDVSFKTGNKEYTVTQIVSKINEICAILRISGL